MSGVFAESGAPRPWIAHVDIDAFFASVEQIRDPQLRGRPVAVGYGVVASCSYEARARGCTTAMRLSEARRVCPELVVLDGHQPMYRAFAERVFDECRRFSPELQTFLDEAVLDLTGTERLWGHPLRVADTLRRRVRKATGLAVTVGVGSNRMMARLATKRAKPDGMGIVEPGQEAAHLTPLPIEELPGVGHATAERLRALNVTTVGALRTFSREHLVALFGVRGEALHERAHGRDSRVVHEAEIPRSISRETAFHEATSDPEEHRAMLHYLTERAARTARSLGIAARTLAVKVRYADDVSEEVRHTFREGVAVDSRLFTAAVRLLERAHTRRVALHLVGIALSNFVPDAAEQLDWTEGTRAPHARDLCEGTGRSARSLRPRRGGGGTVDRPHGESEARRARVRAAHAEPDEVSGCRVRWNRSRPLPSLASLRRGVAAGACR